MSLQDGEIHALSEYLLDEIVLAFGLKNTPGTHGLFRFFLSKLTNRVASICMETDQIIAVKGFPAATGWMASHWVRQVTSRGSSFVPSDGPLLIVCNHVGAYDILVVPAQINRKDIKIIASASPFFMKLPHASEHMIYASHDAGNRMSAARQAITHLQGGGSLLLFGTGVIDPDPDVYQNANEEIGSWSPSIDLFLRQVPETKVLISIVSGIVLSKWAHSPLTFLREIPWQKRRIAEYGQVLDQLIFTRKPNITPSISFAPPITVEVLKQESGSEKVLPAVITRGKLLLEDHITWHKNMSHGDNHGR